MADPVSELIVKEVKSRLSAYTTTHRSTRVATWQPKDMVVHILQGETVRNDELSLPGNPPAQAWDMTVVVAGIVKPSDTSTTPVDTYKNQFWAEIVKAANTGDNWHTWGDNAINSIISDVEEYTSEDGSVAGVQVSILITFRTDENNPFNGRG